MTVRVLSAPNAVINGGNATLGTATVTALANIGVAKAWAYFNGTNTGTITALASYNVASIARTGTGSYTIVFATALGTTTYPFVGNAVTPAAAHGIPSALGRATTGFSIQVADSGFVAPLDLTNVSFVVFGA